MAPQGLNQACKRCQTGPKKRIAQASGNAALDIRLYRAGERGFADLPCPHKTSPRLCPHPPLIDEEKLNVEAAKRYITNSLKREFASDSGTELNAVLPKMSPLNPLYLTKKQTVFQKIAAFVEKFKGVGGQV